jgi:hypothetical protein
LSLQGNTIHNRQDKKIIEATEEPYKEEEGSTVRPEYQNPGPIPEREAASGPASRQHMSYEKLPQPSTHTGTSWDAPCVYHSPEDTIGELHSQDLNLAWKSAIKQLN